MTQNIINCGWTCRIIEFSQIPSNNSTEFIEIASIAEFPEIANFVKITEIAELPEIVNIDNGNAKATKIAL